ncbi:hypothetical protein F3157_05355 [Virgibacillus dakarensis]|uniref:hypothetical protein n=1 Tax=Virgibacillus dakarensis TaxID=1917889 RepID=UPI000B434B3E|nr:hypothetical protein [Virgibacillus dakarensis]MTW85084.1 hypothetical protein [Virgibacillus dakarensis]
MTFNMNEYGEQHATPFEKEAAEKAKTIVESSQNVNTSEELTELTEAVKQQGGIIIGTHPIRGTQGITVRYRILKD